MDMDRVLFITDLDGTLLNSNQEISGENAKWIREFQMAGGLFTFATGRMDQSAEPYFKKLAVDLPIITYNGARLFSAKENQVISETKMALPAETWKVLLNDDVKKGLFIYMDGQTYILERNSIVDEFEKKEKIHCELAKVEDFNDVSITKVLIIMDQVSKGIVPELKCLKQRIQLVDNQTQMVFSETNYLELLPHNASKGKGVEKLVEFLGVDNIFTIGIGDNLNDITLLNATDLGIAVNNAQNPLKAHADIVLSETNNDNAVAVVLKTVLEMNGQLSENVDYIKSKLKE